MPAEIPPTLPEKKVYPVIDEGVYQAVIVDVESGKQKEYERRFDTAAPDVEAFYVFKFKILTPGPAQGRLLWSKRGKAVLPVPPEGKASESLVFRVASAVTGKKLTFDEGKMWTIQNINALAGKQIVLVVTRATKQDGSEMNMINTFMHAREMLPDIDEEKGGAEANPTTPAAFTGPGVADLGPGAGSNTNQPARYDTVPPELRPDAKPSQPNA